MTPDRLLVGDCRELLRSFPDGCFDACITDPPYGVPQPATENDWSRRSNPKRCTTRTGMTWDVADWSWLPELCRVLAPGGQAIIFTRETEVGEIHKAAAGSDLKPRGRFVWVKSSVAPRGARKLYSAAFEMIVWLAKDGYYWKQTPDGPERWNVLFGPTIASYPDERTGHPTQKPLWIAKQMVERHCPPGGLVLDPFCGAGTIPLACANLGRRYIGVDCEAHWVEVSEKRLAEAARNRNLKLPLEVNP